MIFLSHNSKDKVLVEPIAVRLRNLFGQDLIFYDSWSIQPGDGIIDKMDSGLKYCQYFFLFISRNSLDSKMVKLEWQNALFRAAQGELKIIPVRLDTSLIPPILMQTLYLDLYTNGLEVVVNQMISVINGSNTFTPSYTMFSNIKATVLEKEDSYDIDFEAIHYMEPHAAFIILLNNKSDEFSIELRGSGMLSTGFSANVKLNNGIVGNAWVFSITQALVPSFPLQVKLQRKNPSNTANILSIMHEQEKNSWVSIPYYII